jgi:hypothetical protein
LKLIRSKSGTQSDRHPAESSVVIAKGPDSARTPV